MNRDSDTHRRRRSRSRSFERRNSRRGRSRSRSRDRNRRRDHEGSSKKSREDAWARARGETVYKEGQFRRDTFKDDVHAGKSKDAGITRTSYDNSATVYVTGLPKNVTVEKLEATFGMIGTIARKKGKGKKRFETTPKIVIYKNPDGSIRGDAAIGYEDPNAALHAPEFFNGHDWEGTGAKLTCEIGKKKVYTDNNNNRGNSYNNRGNSYNNRGNSYNNRGNSYNNRGNSYNNRGNSSSGYRGNR